MNAPNGNRPAQGHQAPAPVRRIVLSAMAAGLLYWAIDGLWRDNISMSQYFFTQFFGHVHFRGPLAWLAATGLILGAVAIALFLVEDFRTPPGQPINRKLADRVASGAMAIIGALVMLAFFKLI